VLTAFVSDKERSLEETKQIVQKKLGLSSDTPIELAQLRGGKRIDLEDGTSLRQSASRKFQFPSDDDFEAFKALTRTLLHATVEVTIPEDIRLLPNPHVCLHPLSRILLITTGRGKVPLEKGRTLSIIPFQKHFHEK
jgi:hypothetical protein